MIQNDANEIKILVQPQPAATLDKTKKEAREAIDAIKLFVQDMINKNGKFDVQSSLLLTKLVKEVIELADVYKQLKGDQKKQLVLTLVKEVFETELAASDLPEDTKNIIDMIVSNSIEPAIDLAIYVAKGGIKIDKKKTKKMLKKLCPCMSLE